MYFNILCCVSVEYVNASIMDHHLLGCSNHSKFSLSYTKMLLAFSLLSSFIQCNVFMCSDKVSPHNLVVFCLRNLFKMPCS